MAWRTAGKVGWGGGPLLATLMRPFAPGPLAPACEAHKDPIPIAVSLGLSKTVNTP